MLDWQQCSFHHRYFRLFQELCRLFFDFATYFVKWCHKNAWKCWRFSLDVSQTSNELRNNCFFSKLLREIATLCEYFSKYFEFFSKKLVGDFQVVFENISSDITKLQFNWNTINHLSISCTAIWHFNSIFQHFHSSKAINDDRFVSVEDCFWGESQPAPII